MAYQWYQTTVTVGACKTHKPAVAGQGEVIFVTILVLPVRCLTGGIVPYLRIQSTLSHLLPLVLMSNRHYNEWRTDTRTGRSDY